MVTAQLRSLQQGGLKRKQALPVERQIGPVKVQVLSAVGGDKASGGVGCSSADIIKDAVFGVPSATVPACMSSSMPNAWPGSPPFAHNPGWYFDKACLPVAEAAKAFLQQRLQSRKRSNDMLRPAKQLNALSYQPA